MAKGEEKKFAPLVIAIRDKAGNPCRRHDRQREFQKGQATHKFNFAGGAKGPGKTSEICLEAGIEIGRALSGGIPPINIACLHEDNQSAYDVLVSKIFGKQDSIIPRYILYGEKKIDLQIKKNESKRELEIGLGGKVAAFIYWQGMDESKDQPNDFATSGKEFDLIIGSQIERWEESAFWACRDRLGRREIPNFLPRILFDGNICFHWPKQTWLDLDLVEGDNPSDYFFLNWVTVDNPSLPESYIAQQKASPNAAQDFHGLWDDAVGRIYGDFKRESSLVNFHEVPFRESWTISAALDWGGQHHPFAVLYYAVDHQGNLFFLDEDEFYNHTARQAADRVRDGHRKLMNRICDILGVHEIPPDMWGGYYGGTDFNRRENSGHSLGDQMLHDMTDPKHGTNEEWTGIYVQTITLKAPKDVRDAAFINSLQQQMTQFEGHKHPISGKEPASRFYLTKDCKRLLAQITTASRDPDKPYKIRKNEIKNKFSSDPNAVHHWDIHDCGLLASQQIMFQSEPEERAMEDYTTKLWKRIHKQGSRKATRNASIY